MHIFLPGQVKYILDTLENAGFAAYAVGGCVRDSIIGVEPGDWDVCTSAAPNIVEECFKNDRTVNTGIRYGTVTVFAGGGQEGTEVTTFRTENGYSDNRRPDSVEFVSSLTEDLKRRDFTINAMAYSPREGLIDLHGGQADLRNHIIRCVGVPEERFSEDALRILRAMRFASVYGFDIEATTAAAIHFKKYLLRTIAGERVNAELNKLLCGVGAERVLMEYSDVIAEIIPEAAPMLGFDQKNRHHCYDVWEHTVKAIASAPRDRVIRFALLMHDIGKPQTFSIDSCGEGHFKGHHEASVKTAEKIMHRLRFKSSDTNRILLLIKYHDSICEPTDRSVCRRLGKLGGDTFKMLLEVQRADTRAHSPEYIGERLNQLASVEAKLTEVIADRKCFSLATLDICGDDVKSAGISEGKRVGELLDILLQAVIDGKCENTHINLTEYLRKIIGKSQNEN